MKRTLNSNMIKLVAIIAMTIDHIAWLLFPGYPSDVIPVVLHIIGRITCPVMCYFIAEGYHFTKDINRYTADCLCSPLYRILPICSLPKNLSAGNPLYPSITATF